MTSITPSVAADEALSFASRPARYFGHSWYAMQHVDPALLHQLQLTALQQRVATLREQIPALGARSKELGDPAVNELDDVVPLLFQHSVYKSYPSALLDKARFTDLTHWLDRLTTHDLSSVDVHGADSIDAWLDILERDTPVHVAHSSGTTGTISFLPRDLEAWDRYYEAMHPGMFQFSDPRGEFDHTGEYFELVWPLYEGGRSAIARVPQMAMPHIIGSPERLHALRKGRMSADAMYLAGRISAATARGELDRLQISPALAGRRAEFEQERREMSESLPNFLENTIHDLRGRRIWIIATWNVLHDMARAGLERGFENVFAPESLVCTGGGAKGQVVPDGWEDTVCRFMGVDRLQNGYSMTEITGYNKMCEHDRYHFEPWLIPFVLDPADGRPLPRSGRQRGRCAIFDLLPDTYWGGFITGDEVTADFSPCPCGRTTVHIDRQIERFGDKHGDDKITCAASDDAHRGALELLHDRLG